MNKPIQLKLLGISPAYLAGLFDAEGCICSRIKDYRLEISIGNTNLSLLMEIQKYFGGKININKIHNKNRKFYYILGWYNIKDQKQILKLMLPYLKVKKIRALFALMSLELREKRRRKFTKEDSEILSQISKLIKFYNNNCENEEIDGEINYEWLAGFIDGDGCLIYFPFKRKNKIYYYPRIGICNNNKKVIKWLHQQLGGSFIKDRNKSKYKKRNFYRLLICGQQAKELLNKIENFFILKRQKAKDMLNNWNQVEIIQNNNK